MPARLTLHFAAAPAREQLLPEDRETVVGRGTECGVVIDDDRVSRRHAALTPGLSGWTVADLGSKNGTRVDGVAVDTGPLPASGWISFGGVLARFEAGLEGGAAQTEERLRRLTTALGAHRGIDPEIGLQELLARVVASMLALANAERGFLLLVGADGDFEVAARSGLSWDDLRSAEFGGSVGAVVRALESGRAVVSADVRADAELAARESVVAGGIRALLSVPVQAFERRIGVMYADSRQPGAAFTDATAMASPACVGGELRGLAGRLAHEIGGGPDPALRARLAGQITEILDRSLQGVPATRNLADTWQDLLASRTPPGGAP